MRFSIIVVSLNAGDELLGTINSILEQTYQDYEIVIKDGGSSDGSLTKLPASDKIRLVTREDKSIYDAMNQAILEAQGDYYIFLNCGDYFYDKTVLARTAKEIIGSQADILYGNLVRRDVEGLIASSPQITDFTCYRNIPCHQVCFYKKSMFEARGYDLSYPVRADYEHFLYCKYELGASFHYMDFVVALYEGAGFSETKASEKKAAIEHRIITNKYLGAKCYWYRFIMLVTFQPLRKRIAAGRFSVIYQKIKEVIYGRKKA